MLQGDNQSQPTFTSLYRAVCGQLLQVSTHHTIPANVFPLSSEEFHWFWLYLYFRDRLCGEECYWWMQFVGAVEFIKTMEWIYTECRERGDIKWSWAGVIDPLDYWVWPSIQRRRRGSVWDWLKCLFVDSWYQSWFEFENVVTNWKDRRGDS